MLSFHKIPMWLICVVGILILLVSALLFVGMNMTVSFGYSIRAEFSSMPPNDQELKNWLCGQPGVVRDTVGVWRERQFLRSHWVMMQTVDNKPPAPDLKTAWERLGYMNPKNIDWNWSTNKEEKEKEETKNNSDTGVAKAKES